MATEGDAAERARADRRPDAAGPARGDEHPGAAELARADVRELAAARGHPTDNALLVLDRLERAFAAGDLQRTPFLARAMGDLRLALAQDEGQRLGGKSAEAARVIMRAIVRGLEEA